MAEGGRQRLVVEGQCSDGRSEAYGKSQISRYELKYSALHSPSKSSRVDFRIKVEVLSSPMGPRQSFLSISPPGPMSASRARVNKDEE